MNQNRAIIYVRVSSDDQVKGTSLESQEEICRAYCQRNKLEVDRVFIEMGASAKTSDRPVFQEAIKYCAVKAKTISKFVVYKTDRFARNSDDFGSFRMLLSRYGIMIDSATEPVQDNSAGRLTQTMFAAIAQFDNEVRSERAHLAMRQKNLNGAWTFTAPVGFVTARIGDTPALAEDTDKAPLIRLLFENIAAGKWTVPIAVKELYSMGLRSTKGCKLCHQSIRAILRRPVYCGIVQNSLTDDQPVDAVFDGLVSKELFERVQLILSGRSQNLSTPYQKVHDDFPLRGFVTCDKCGSPLTGSYSRGRGGKYPYYHCYGCRKLTVRKEKLEEEFEQLLIQVQIRNEGLLCALLAVCKDIWHQEHADMILEKSRMESELKQKERMNSTLIDKLISGVITDELYQDKRTELELDIAMLKSKVHDIELDEYDIETMSNLSERLLNYLPGIWRRSSTPDKQRFQQSVFIDKIAYSKKTGFGTSVTCCIFDTLRVDLYGSSRMACQTRLSWNHLLAFTRRIESIGDLIAA